MNDAGGGRSGAPRLLLGALACLAVLTACVAGDPAGEAAVDDAGVALGAPAPPSDARGGTARGYDIPRLEPQKLRLSGAASSLDDLLRTVETALAERDSVRLFELMVTAAEYEEILFPAFPAAHPPIGASFETIWVLHVTDALRGLRSVLRDFGGKDLRILDVSFEKPDQDYVNFVLHETSSLNVEMDGRRFDGVRLFGSVFHVGDQYKVLSYPDD